ncbi:MAG: hypothetical protein K0S74_1819 [Chlamydiales bacterium]|jgi:hypothetical protein|nr:hypothetical protein [Chlamydiales bacterium]
MNLFSQPYTGRNPLKRSFIATDTDNDSIIKEAKEEIAINLEKLKNSLGTTGRHPDLFYILEGIKA